MAKAKKAAAVAVVVPAEPALGWPRDGREKVFTQLMKDYTAAARRGREYVERLATAAATYGGAGLAREMEWGDAAVDTMAESAVFHEILTGLWNAENAGRPCSLEDLRSTVYREMTRRARNGSRSTSVLTNKMEAARLAAWTNVLEAIDAAEEV